MHFHSSCIFDTDQSLLVDFDLCAPTRLVFFTLVSHCWWTLACALPLVLSFLTLVFVGSTLCIVGPRTYNFMYCRSKDLLLYVL